MIDVTIKGRCGYCGARFEMETGDQMVARWHALVGTPRDPSSPNHRTFQLRCECGATHTITTSTLKPEQQAQQQQKGAVTYGKPAS